MHLNDVFRNPIVNYGWHALYLLVTLLLFPNSTAEMNIVGVSFSVVFIMTLVCVLLHPLSFRMDELRNSFYESWRLFPYMGVILVGFIWLLNSFGDFSWIFMMLLVEGFAFFMHQKHFIATPEASTLYITCSLLLFFFYMTENESCNWLISFGGAFFLSFLLVQCSPFRPSYIDFQSIMMLSCASWSALIGFPFLTSYLLSPFLFIDLLANSMKQGAFILQLLSLHANSSELSTVLILSSGSIIRKMLNSKYFNIPSISSPISTLLWDLFSCTSSIVLVCMSLACVTKHDKIFKLKNKPTFNPIPQHVRTLQASHLELSDNFSSNSHFDEIVDSSTIEIQNGPAFDHESGSSFQSSTLNNNATAINSHRSQKTTFPTSLKSSSSVRKNFKHSSASTEDNTGDVEDTLPEELSNQIILFSGEENNYSQWAHRWHSVSLCLLVMGLLLSFIGYIHKNFLNPPNETSFELLNDDLWQKPQQTTITNLNASERVVKDEQLVTEFIEVVVNANLHDTNDKSGEQFLKNTELEEQTTGGILSNKHFYEKFDNSTVNEFLREHLLDPKPNIRT